LAAHIPDGFSRNEGKSLVRGQNREISRGLIANTKIKTAGLVAATGLQMVGMLSREANFQSDGDPATATRLNFIVDRYAEFVGNEISRFGF
jgi:hypothetical protein